MGLRKERAGEVGTWRGGAATSPKGKWRKTVNGELPLGLGNRAREPATSVRVRGTKSAAPLTTWDIHHNFLTLIGRDLQPCRPLWEAGPDHNISRDARDSGHYFFLLKYNSSNNKHSIHVNYLHLRFFLHFK